MTDLRITIIKEMLVLCDKEIIKAKLSIGFYTQQAEKQDKETSAKTLLKVKQLEESMKFNEEYREFLLDQY